MELKILGEGAFGVVREVERHCDGVHVAIKSFPWITVPSFTDLPDGTPGVPEEIVMMEQVKNVPHVSKIHELFYFGGEYKIVMDLLPGSMDLHTLQKDHGPIPQDLAVSIMKQTAKIIRDCASAGVIHRDIKTENLMYNIYSQEVIMVDFGLATTYKTTPFMDDVGTILCNPPEHQLGLAYYGDKAAAWSLGVVFFELTHGQPPFKSTREICDKTLKLGKDISAGILKVEK